MTAQCTTDNRTIFHIGEYMDKERQARQRRNKRLGKLVRSYVETEKALVADMRQRVANGTTKPVNWVSSTKPKPGLSRKKRTSNVAGRFVAGKFVVDGTSLNDGLRHGFDKCGIWSSKQKKWFFPIGQEPNGIRPTEYRPQTIKQDCGEKNAKLSLRTDSLRKSLGK